MKKFVHIAAAGALAMAGATSAIALPEQTVFEDAGLQDIGSYYGHISWSIDGASDADHTAGDEITISVDKPEGATVRAALFIGGDGGNRNTTGYTPTDVYLNEQNVLLTHWAKTTTCPGGECWNNFNTYYGDVTDLIKSDVDAAEPGIIDFSFDQGDGVDGDSMEGGALVVIFDDPNAPMSSIYLRGGTSDPDGDSFTFEFPALTSENLAYDINLSVGISNSYQWGGWSQTSNITANGTLLSNISGGCDDSEEYNNSVSCGFGGYNTVGGIEDNINNPGNVDSEVTGYDVNLDNELYDLDAVLVEGDTSLTVDTVNPSANDNIYFAGIYLRSVLPTATFCDDNPVECGISATDLASTGAEGVDFMTHLGGGLLVAGIAVAVYRITTRRKTKESAAE